MDPPALKRKPVIFGLEWIWEAFWRLSTCRSFGMDLGPIPWSDIYQYASHMGLDRDMKEYFGFCIMSMDKDFLDWKEKHKPKKPSESA